MNGPLIEFKGIVKRFPGVTALGGVSFSILAGEVHAIVGENGAGKSTLMNILGGQYRPDEGEILFKGKRAELRSQYDARRLGIGVVYQELRLCPNLTIAENVFLGREREMGRGKVDWRLMGEEAARILAELGSELSPDLKVGTLSVANQQIVEIARAISLDSEVIVMDEPTSALTLKESRKLFKTIASLKAKGVTIIYISHRLEEIFEIADRISVLRDGEYICTRGAKEIGQQEVVNLIAGKELSQERSAKECVDEVDGPVVLKIEGLSRPGRFTNVSFELHAKEILGIYGLQGSGRTELLETIFGLAPAWSGEIWKDGERIANRSAAEAIRNGFAMVPENRRDSGIFAKMDIEENINTANPSEMSGFLGFLRRRFMAKVAKESVDALSIKTNSLGKKLSQLSGGNQQKVVIAKWLATHPQIFLVDELTRGIDVGAKAEIYKILRKLREDGLSILFVSSELAEVINECDRVLVMKNGSLVATLAGECVTKEQVIANAL